jgi:hypothetical protein
MIKKGGAEDASRLTEAALCCLLEEWKVAGAK